VYAEQPSHPGAAHYLIHAYDYPELAPRALDPARHYGRIAPAMPHALHMPSHTFIAVGMWPESIESNLSAGAAARNLGWVQEELHTMDYLVYAYLQGAQVNAARSVLNQLREVNVDESAHLAGGLCLGGRARPVGARAAALGRCRRVATPSRFPATQALTSLRSCAGCGAHRRDRGCIRGC
jgi:hypothetical protein